MAAAGMAAVESASSPPEIAAPTAQQSQGWLAALRPDIEVVEDETDLNTEETTGMLAAIPTLLPAEKLSISSSELNEEPDSILNAARDFYTIATQPSQPATLPAPISRTEKLATNSFRAILLLIFISILAIPLIMQNLADAESDNQRVPWTEPDQEFSDVLDSQRRQLISEQLGIIDLQQPDSLALVSFDYSTATQGEMQPLAEALLGRLKGQGMRIITISLEPEGAAIAQQTLQGMLEDLKEDRDREEKYGETMINLGYLPGQMAAIRQLFTNDVALAKQPDFEENLPLSSRNNWSDIQHLGQVAILVTLTDNPTTARWWIEQRSLTPAAISNENQYLLAATSATANPFLTPYRDSEQLDGLISGINGAAAIEAGRRTFGPARQMLDSQSLAHLALVIIIAVGIIVGWMPSQPMSQAAPQPPQTPSSEPGKKNADNEDA